MVDSGPVPRRYDISIRLKKEWSPTRSLDISDDLRTLLADEFYHEEKYSEGEIYRKIRQYKLDRKPIAAARWSARLSKNKKFEIKRLQRRDDFTAAFNALLDIPGLWRDGMRLGVTKAMLDLRCDEVKQSLYILEIC